MKSKPFFELPLSGLTIFLTMCIMILVMSNLKWSGTNWDGIISSDTKGYYAYLPAVFIYQDLNFGFFDSIEKEKYYNPNFFADYRSSYKGQTINKFYCGTAVVITPFFLIAHSIAKVSDADPDGYSKPYPILISIAALFYLFIGLVFLRKVLGHYTHLEWLKSLALLAAVFGTNLFYYTIGEPGMSHVYSFALICVFAFLAIRYFKAPSTSAVLLLAVVFGLIILIRPINVLAILLLPLLSLNIQSAKRGIVFLFQQKGALLTGILAILFIVSIQLIIYKISTGSFVVYSYGSEGFDFSNPHFVDILFSYKKGLFLYTPIFLLGSLGFLTIWPTRKFETLSFLIFFLLLTYVFSSWWMWYYGGSFSSRVYVEYIPIFMIGLVLLVESFKNKKLRTILVTTILLLIVVCQIQIYQFRYEEIHWSEMNSERYWEVFLRVDRLMK